MPRNRLIITYTAGYLKTFTRRRIKTRKLQGKVKGSGNDNRMGIFYQSGYGQVESTRCASLERAKERCSHQGKYAYGKYSDTIKRAVFYDSNGDAHNVTPDRMADKPGLENFRANVSPARAGHQHGTRAMRAQRKKWLRKLKRDADMVKR